MAVGTNKQRYAQFDYMFTGMSERQRDKEINKLESKGINPNEFYKNKTRAQVDEEMQKLNEQPMRQTETIINTGSMYTNPVNQRFIDQQNNAQKRNVYVGDSDENEEMDEYDKHLAKPTSSFIPPMYNKPENMRWFDQEREQSETKGIMWTGPSEALLKRCYKLTDSEMK